MAGQPLNEVNNSFFLIILLVVTQEKRSRKQKLPVTPSISIAVCPYNWDALRWFIYLAMSY